MVQAAQAIRIDSIRVSNGSPWQDEQGRRGIRISVLVKGSPDLHRLTPVRIPLVIQSSKKIPAITAGAVGILNEGVSAAVADVSLPIGRYVITCALTPGLTWQFRLAADQMAPVLYCGHGERHPSEFQTRVVADGNGKALLTDQEVTLRPCCRVRFPAWRSNNVHALGIYIPLAGRFRLHAGDRVLTVGEGEYLVVNPEDTTWPDDRQAWPIRLFQIIIYQSALRQFREAIGCPQSMGPFGFEPGAHKLTGTMAEAFHFWQEGRQAEEGPDREALVQTACRLVLIQLFRQHPSKLRTRSLSLRSEQVDGRLDKAARLITQQQAKGGEVKLGEIAREVGVGESWLRRRFQEVYHKSPKEYAQWARVQEAVRLLRETSYTVQEISKLLGYQDASAFYRVFKKYAHGLPKALRSPRRSTGELIKKA